MRVVAGEGNMWMWVGGPSVNLARNAFRPGEGKVVVRSRDLQAKKEFDGMDREDMRPQIDDEEFLYAFSAK